VTTRTARSDYGCGTRPRENQAETKETAVNTASGAHRARTESVCDIVALQPEWGSPCGRHSRATTPELLHAGRTIDMAHRSFGWRSIVPPGAPADFHIVPGLLHSQQKDLW